jgi:hypothetical protein
MNVEKRRGVLGLARLIGLLVGTGAATRVDTPGLVLNTLLR